MGVGHEREREVEGRRRSREGDGFWRRCGSEGTSNRGEWGSVGPRVAGTSGRRLGLAGHEAGGAGLANGLVGNDGLGGPAWWEAQMGSSACSLSPSCFLLQKRKERKKERLGKDLCMG